jgi:F0F1-type ATP synthase membrane subunit b/b'
VAELRGDVASLAVGAAEKILGKSVDKSVQEKALREAASDLDAWSKAKN